MEKYFFVIAGVNGPTIFQDKNPYLLDDVTSQKTHITLQVKPNAKLREHFGKVHNGMIQLTDVGDLINDFVFSKVQPQPFTDWYSQRNQTAIGVRSDWGVWRMDQILPIEGLRMDQYLFTFSPRLRVYDSFTDSKEIDPLPMNEAISVAKQYKIDQYIKKLKLDTCIASNFEKVLEALPGSVNCGQLLPLTVRKAKNLGHFLKWRWQNTDSDESFADILWENIDKFKKVKNSVVHAWLSYYFLREERWDDLLKLSSLEKNEYWKLVAFKNKNKEIKNEIKDCRLYFLNTKTKLSNFYRHCEDSSLRKVAEGLSVLKAGKKPHKSFWHQVEDIKLKRKVKMLNLEMMLMNDVSEALYFEPTLSEIYFYLPENKEFKKLIEVN